MKKSGRRFFWLTPGAWLAICAAIAFIVGCTLFWLAHRRQNIGLVYAPTPSLAERVKINYVIDGDTVILADGRHVRYIGIDAPELQPEEGVENREEIIRSANASRRENERLVLNKEVLLEKDVQEFDKYGRTLAYVWVEGKLVNEELLRTGAAQLLAIPPDIKYAERFKTVVGWR